MNWPDRRPSSRRARCPSLRVFSGPDLGTVTTVEAILDSLLERLAERNSDFYELVDGRLIRR